VFLSLLVGCSIGLLGGFVLGRVSVDRTESDSPVTAARSERDARNAHATDASMPAEAPTGRRRVSPTSAAASETPLRSSRTPLGDSIAPAPLPPTSDGSANPYGDWTKEQFLEQFRRAASGAKDIGVHGLVVSMQKVHGGVHVPLDVVLGMIRSGHSFGAPPLVEALSDGELRTVIRLATAARTDDTASWGLAIYSANVIQRRGLVIDPQTIRALLDHELWTVRYAGVVLASGSVDNHRSRLMQLASDEPKDDLRADAIALMVKAEDGPPSAETLRLVRTALANGGPRVRVRASELLLHVGPKGGEIALDVLVQSSYAPDPRIAHALYRTVLKTGRAPQVLVASKTDATLFGIARNLPEAVDEDPDVLAGLEPHIADLAAAMPTDDLWDFYDALAKHGHGEFVARAALDSTLTAGRREVAFSGLWSAAEGNDTRTGPLIDVATRLVWDDSLAVWMRGEALNAIASANGGRETAFAIQLRILRDTSTPPALRSTVIEDLINDFEDDALNAHWPESRAVWREVAENDPVLWLRTLAEEKLKDNER